jgi:hypothetical protein
MPVPPRQFSSGSLHSPKIQYSFTHRKQRRTFFRVDFIKIFTPLEEQELKLMHQLQKAARERKIPSGCVRG